MGRDELFEYVRETTSLASDRDVMSRVKRSKDVLPSTQKTYEKIAADRLDFDHVDGGSMMNDVSARSWHVVKAGLLHVSSQRYKAERKLCDDAQRTGDYETAEKHAILARNAVVAIQNIEDAERPKMVEKRATKRSTIPRSDDWQARVYHAATEPQKASVAIMWAVGARPDEVEQGIDIIWYENPTSKKEELLIKIKGSKITENSGQEERYIAIDPDSETGKILTDHMGDSVKISIQRKARRMNKDFEKIRSITGLAVSPYSLRHQFSANIKAEFGPDRADDIARCLGHATTRSQVRYGSVQQAQSGSTGITMVKATRSIRETRSDPRPENAGQDPAPRPG